MMLYLFYAVLSRRQVHRKSVQRTGFQLVYLNDAIHLLLSQLASFYPPAYAANPKQ
jgi:hypothetical protein